MHNNYKYPFKETIDNGYSIRIFKHDVDPELLVWHRDKEDRIIKCDHPTNWKFQLDNELPISFDKQIFVKKDTWHRLIKGDNNIELKIKKLN